MENFSALYQKIKEFYGVTEKKEPRNSKRDKKNQHKPEDQQSSLVIKAVEKYGYLPMPYQIAREQLHNNAIFAGLEKMWKMQNVMEKGKFCDNPDINPLARMKYEDCSWIIREQHKIESLTLMGLTEMENEQIKGVFKNLLVKILTTPSGSSQERIPATTFYLLPFFRRDMAFRSVYCPVSSEIDQNLVDKELQEKTGIDGETQIALFIQFANLAGHPVVMDILPQTGRFSKTVMANPECFRWYDLHEMLPKLVNKADIISLYFIKYLGDGETVEAAAEALKDEITGKPLVLKTQEDRNNLKTAIRTLYHEISVGIIKQEKKGPKGYAGISSTPLKEKLLESFQKLDHQTILSRFELRNEMMPFLQRAFRFFVHLKMNLDIYGKQLTDYMMEKASQQKIVARAQDIIAKTLCRKVRDERTITDEEHRNLIASLQKEGLWPVGGGCWNSAGHPVLNHINASDGDPYYSYPVSDHYNYHGAIVNGYAGDMDIVAPWYFAYLEDAWNMSNLNESVVSTYLDYYYDIYCRFKPNGFRIDHLDHSADTPTSLNKKGNPISYRSPLSVFKRLGEKIRKDNPMFAMFAEYMGWGDDTHPHLYRAYQENGINLSISTDVVGEYRINAPIIVNEGNIVLEKYNENATKPAFSLTRILDNHDRAHPDILPALSEFTEDRALLKWIKCLFLPGGKFASRPSLYLDGNQTHTPNEAFKQTFLDCRNLARNSNYGFFVRFDSLLRFSLNEPTLLYGRAELLNVKGKIERSQPEQPTNNIVSAWIVWPDQEKSRPIVAVANEWIDDKTSTLSIQGPLEIALPAGWKPCNEIILPPKEMAAENTVFYLTNIPEIVEKPFSKDGMDVKVQDTLHILVLEGLQPNQFKIFRLMRA